MSLYHVKYQKRVLNGFLPVAVSLHMITQKYWWITLLLIATVILLSPRHH